MYMHKLEPNDNVADYENTRLSLDEMAVAQSCKLGPNDNVTDYENTRLQAVEGIS